MDIQIDRLEIKTKIRNEQVKQFGKIGPQNSEELEILIEKYLDKKLRDIMNN
jgi:hypothetical protein